MLKNAYFFGKKTVKIASASGAPPPNPVSLRRLGLRLQTPALLLLPTIAALTSSFLALLSLKKEQNNYSKCSVFASSALLHLFFTSNSVVLLPGGARIFLDPGHRVPRLRH